MSRKRIGFTLVEILIAMGIMTILITAGIAQYIRYNQRQRSKAVIDRVRQVLQEAKANAISGKKDCLICGGTNQKCDEIVEAVHDLNLQFWQVIITNAVPPARGSYTSRGVCGGAVFMSRTESFPNTVQLFSTCGSVSFTPAGGTTLGATCWIMASSGGFTYWVSVTTNGAVN